MDDNVIFDIEGQREDAIKWGGIPPAGENSIDDGNKFVGKVLLTLAICVGIWTIYRAVGGQIFEGLHTKPSMISDFFAKPLFTVLPIYILWRILFKEKRAPVRFGRKNMASGIISALVLVSAFIFLLYVSQIIFFRMFGVMEAGSVELIPGWRYMGTVEFILIWLMFVASTGFAEEYEARGFLQDQLMRVQSPWKSILITALIFAAAHIPIFIFIHHLEFWQGFYYFVYLVPMSFFLSIYYHWSRNLPAVMIYHGLFDWMLSAIYITARYDVSYESSIHVQWGIFFIASLFAITINLALLYVFYRIFWKKDRPSGSMGFKVPVISDWKGPRPRRIRSDDSSVSWGKTIFALGVATVLFSGLVMGFGAAFGTMDPSVVGDRIVGEDEKETASIFDLELLTIEMSAVRDHVSEGQTLPIPLVIEEVNVANIHFKLTWRDEADSDVTHQNQPDTFTISFASPDGSISEEANGKNEQGGEGVIEFVKIIFNEDFPPSEIPFLNGTGEWAVVVSVNAGDHEPLIPDPILGLRTVGDTGNDFTLEISYDYYKEKE